VAGHNLRIGMTSHMPRRAKKRFLTAFKLDLDKAALGLPPGYRKVFWATDCDGDDYAILGRTHRGFILTPEGSKIILADAGWALPSLTLGTWEIDACAAQTVAQAVLDGLTALAKDEADLPPCSLGAWDNR
jgi:hypothetical protein